MTDVLAGPSSMIRLEGGEVAVYAPHATAAQVCLFDEKGERETLRIHLSADGQGYYKGFAPGLIEGARYGLRVDGPFDPVRGHRFDAAKLLVDPLSPEIDRPFALHASMFERGADSAAAMPKCVVRANPGGEIGHARIPPADSVIYEINLRSFSRLRVDIPQAARGRFAALAEPPLIHHIQSLGVTTVEIMPADAFVDERHLPPLGLSNAWGYNPVFWGAPDPRLAPEGWREVRRATDALHAAGLEVVLDVVLNHNGESDEFGPTLSFRGLDNAAYFRLLPEDASRYINDMGCGNCVALDRPPVVALAVAALRRWMEWGGIDGFRFDLAPALGRRATGFDAHAPMFAALAQDPVLSRAKLIAEPWDIGPGGYRLGEFPAGWGEWNDRFRDASRRYWRGDARMRGELATRLAGSRDMFPHAADATQSVNFVVAHDGFTLADLVSYAHKHNEANGEHNSDGTNDNLSWNHSVEGPTEAPAILAARRRDQRNLLATLFTACGAPMFPAGAELGHSQHGNNNAYAQDNAISWLDWGHADMDLAAFVGRLAAVRAAHPALRRAAWLTGAPIAEGGPVDVEWRDAELPLLDAGHWESPVGEVLTAVFAAPTPQGYDRALVAFNRGPATSLRLPESRAGFVWRVRLDTSDPARLDAPTELADRTPLPERSVLIIAETPISAKIARAPDEHDVNALADAAGVAGEWWDAVGAHTLVSTTTKLALLECFSLPARTQALARESLDRLMQETRARALTPALTLPLDGLLRATLRADPAAPQRQIEFHLALEDGSTLSGATPGADPRRITLPNGREVDERHFDLPALPVGRHRLEVGGVSCALTIAPPEAWRPKATWKRRFGVSAQLYALRRDAGDQGVGDYTALGLAAATAARHGAAYFGLSPVHMLFPDDRSRASPYHPSDRRFLDPILIDALAEGDLPVDEEWSAAAATLGERLSAVAKLGAIDYEAVWGVKRIALQYRFAAFLRARAARSDDPLFAEFDAFVAAGGDNLFRFAVFEAIHRERGGQYWREWPAELRDADAGALAAKAEQRDYDVRFAQFCQWVGDRQLAAAAGRARNAGLDIGLYRDLAVGSAPDGAESWSRAGELGIGATVGAPPDPFSAAGQNWHLPPPDPVAGARTGWKGFADLLAANMRHAGMLRIDHAMGLTRLFVIPDGAKPAEGAYVAYPADELIGQIALESQRNHCMVIGEDLGNVPDGFRDKMTKADISGMRVLYFERDGVDFSSPHEYPVHSVACVTTHDLPPLSGWWQAADIGERMSLGQFGPDHAARALKERLAEKEALLDALVAAGVLAERPSLDAPLDDALAASIHSWVAQAGSALASVQVDDLMGETVATNLPGTDRERPNWRHRSPDDASKLFDAPRARAILAAMDAVRPRP
ncbi:MAG: glycogen debranching protein GlgX [Pseudomonadota bacterium]|nr:glycogen debranching protein GlgX [Pseudomonadota bacterium]